MVARNEQEPGRRRLPPAAQHARSRWSGAPTSAPTPTTRSAVDIRVMSGERDSPDPLDCQDVGVATLNLPDRLPARSPIRVKFAINRTAGSDVIGDRPDRRRLDRRRVRDRGRHERRGSRRALDGAAVAECVVNGGDRWTMISSAIESMAIDDLVRSRARTRRERRFLDPRASAGKAIRSLLRMIGDQPIRLTYDRGDVELMSPLSKHDANRVLARSSSFEILAEELTIPVMPVRIDDSEARRRSIEVSSRRELLPRRSRASRGSRSHRSRRRPAAGPRDRDRNHAQRARSRSASTALSVFPSSGDSTDETLRVLLRQEDGVLSATVRPSAAFPDRADGRDRPIRDHRGIRDDIDELDQFGVGADDVVPRPGRSGLIDPAAMLTRDASMPIDRGTVT